MSRARHIGTRQDLNFSMTRVSTFNCRQDHGVCLVYKVMFRLSRAIIILFYGKLFIGIIRLTWTHREDNRLELTSHLTFFAFVQLDSSSVAWAMGNGHQWALYLDVYSLLGRALGQMNPRPRRVTEPANLLNLSVIRWNDGSSSATGFSRFCHVSTEGFNF
jgi:hypothetical protein